jgi:hypothetical protein
VAQACSRRWRRQLAACVGGWVSGPNHGWIRLILFVAGEVGLPELETGAAPVSSSSVDATGQCVRRESDPREHRPAGSDMGFTGPLNALLLQGVPPGSVAQEA